MFLDQWLLDSLLSSSNWLPCSPHCFLVKQLWTCPTKKREIHSRSLKSHHLPICFMVWLKNPVTQQYRTSQKGSKTELASVMVFIQEMTLCVLDQSYFKACTKKSTSRISFHPESGAGSWHCTMEQSEHTDWNFWEDTPQTQPKTPFSSPNTLWKLESGVLDLM